MSGIKTTVKTDICSFSEYRIYPGRGKKFIGRDGKVYMYVGSKVARLARQRKKAVKLMWTQAWRRSNKKMRVEATQKKKTRKAGKIQKAIVGLTLDEIKRKRAQKPDLRQAARDMALKEAREKQQKKALKKATGGAGGVSQKFGGVGGKGSGGGSAATATGGKGNIPKGGAGSKTQTGGRKK